jgi:ATP-dependent Lhr-like helicase
MMDPRRKPPSAASNRIALRKRSSAPATAGRWSLLLETTSFDPQTIAIPSVAKDPLSAHVAVASQQAIAAARSRDEALDAHARILLCRYGVIFRDLLARESNTPRWRDLLPVLRRLEARGEIRGGRFVSGPFGEQYALPEAVESLHIARRRSDARVAEDVIPVAAADPLNLAGIIVPGERVPAVPGRYVRYRNGAVVEDEISAPLVPTNSSPVRTRNIADLLRADAAKPRSIPPSTRPETTSGLFP